MPATDRILTPARAKGLAAALVLAAAGLVGAGSGAAPAATSGAQHSAASAAGAGPSANLVRFAVDSPAMVQAELVAVKYWNTSPCAGNVSISWAPLDPSINAASTWWNPVAAYGNASANSQCKITLNQNQDFDWPMFCTVMVHEIGHLVGQQHVNDTSSVMYPVYVSPIAECTGAAAGTTPVPPATAPAAAAAASSTKSHKAHSRHKAHKKAKAKHARKKHA
jgi:hypothetical protein